MRIRHDVLIIGCGPTGAVLANLLGHLGLAVVVLERQAAPFTITSTAHLDEETLRNLRTTGLFDELLPHLAPLDSVDVVDADGVLLYQDEVARDAPSNSPSGAWLCDRVACLDVLREGLRRFPSVKVIAGAELQRLVDHGDHVEAVATAAGEPLHVQARWVVGCDGAHGVTRSWTRIALETLAPPHRRLVVNAVVDEPERGAACHYRVTLGHDRVALGVHGPKAHRRWEFQLASHEAPDDDQVRAWLAPHTDLTRTRVETTRIHDLPALLATSLRQGRILLAGDAAHVLPPITGQGMCAGIRDAVNLGYKLARVIRRQSSEALLDTYDLERRAHVRAFIQGAVFISNRLFAQSALQRQLRRLQLQLMYALPSIQAVIRRRSVGPSPLRGGFLDPRSPLAGHLLPLVNVHHGSTARRIDDALDYRFALLASPGVLCPADLAWARERDMIAATLGVELVEVGEILACWMHHHRATVLLIRPDRRIFSAGGRDALPRMMATFDASAQEPSTVAHPSPESTRLALG